MDHVEEVEYVLNKGEVSLNDLILIRKKINSRIEDWGTDGPALIF